MRCPRTSCQLVTEENKPEKKTEDEEHVGLGERDKALKLFWRPTSIDETRRSNLSSTLPSSGRLPLIIRPFQRAKNT